MTRTAQAAAQLDTSIDTLLGQRGRVRPLQEDGLVATARLLRDVLPRFHPRFGFEDLLAHRLAAPARTTPAGHDEPIPLRHGAPSLTDEPGAETVDCRRRGLVAGGAIASGVSLAIPIAGAALLVWRRSRSSGGIL